MTTALGASHMGLFPHGGLYRSTKRYDHNEGLSCCFRQWRADSHCRQVHGYSFGILFVFATERLDERNWCFDFGSMKPIRNWLHDLLDHTMLVAEDDPHLETFRTLEASGLVALRLLPAVGCEALARYVFDYVSTYVLDRTGGRVILESVEVSEHSGNSALYTPGPRHS